MPNCRGLVALILTLGFLAASATLLIYARRTDPPPYVPTTAEAPNVLNYPGTSPGAVAGAAKAPIPDGEAVIGVEVEGRYRAYRVADLSDRRSHVVNDVVAGRPVTVTYCDLNNCIRVFTGDVPAPLDIGIGGYDNGLVLLAGGERYRQDTQAPVDPANRAGFPHHLMRFERTTWKRWREAHPDTDVVLGLSFGN